MSYRYEKENGNYSLYDQSGLCVLSNQSSVGICYDKESKTLLKHGNVSMVSDYAKVARASFLAMGLSDFSENIEFVSGRFKVEELNNLISTSGYIERFLKAHDIGVEKGIER